MNVLFVCEGNMTRSQMAEAFYNVLTSTHDATSAGAIAEVTDTISPEALDALQKVGIDGSNLRPVQLTPEMVEQVEKVVYFPSDFMPPYVTDSPKSELWDVADPYYHKDKGAAFVEAVRDDIRARVEKMAGKSA